ncbi:MAG: FAD-dependent oxidoreductase [Flavobacteriales bacterium]
MEKIAVIGAGLVGSLQAIYLAKKGFKVEVYERRSDMRKAKVSAGKSINLALSDRGWKALEGAGIADEIKKVAIPMYGRRMHLVDGALTYQPYGKQGQAIYSVSRGGLNQKLIEVADKFENIDFFFNQRCLDINLSSNTIYFQNEENDQQQSFSFDRVFATDGAFSAIRQRMMKQDRFNYQQHYIPHGYKELSIHPNTDGTHKMEANSLHIWPRGEFMLIALPNLDGSFTCTLFFPFEGKDSFESIKNEADLMLFFNRVFPDVVKLMPNLAEDYFSNPTSSLVIVRCDPWNYEDKVMLMGDSAHAIVPFYGQGMNCGFEDCTVFNEFFEVYAGDWEKIFHHFAKTRKPDGDAIADLALRNFIEMRDLTAEPKFLLQKKIEGWFSEKHPDNWIPLYSQVTFSHIPYSQALKNGKRQDEIMEQVMNMPNIENIWNSPEVEQKILSYLA